MIRSRTARLLRNISHPVAPGYLQELEQSPVLSRERCLALAHQYHREKDQEAGHQLISSHLRLVVKIVQDFYGYWQGNIIDLIQEGNIGLILALQRFDPGRNVQFSTYAFYWIHAYIQKYVLNNWRLVKICTARSKRLLFLRLIREQSALAAQGPLCDRLLADRLRVSESEIADMLQRMHGEDVVFEDFEMSLSYHEHQLLEHNGTNGAEKQVVQEIKERVRRVISKIKNTLCRREQAILELRLLSNEPTSLQEIGDTFNLSSERIRQIEKNLFEKLKRAFSGECPGYS